MFSVGPALESSWVDTLGMAGSNSVGGDAYSGGGISNQSMEVELVFT
jgi:hypothetical protein